MVKNKNGGNRHKKMARKNVRTTFNKRVRKAKDADEIYAKVEKMYGGGHASVICNDGRERLLVISKKFGGRNKRDNHVKEGSYLLVGKRSWQLLGDGKKEKVDLLEVYSNANVDELRKEGIIFNFDPQEKKEDDGGFEITNEEDIEYDIKLNMNTDDNKNKKIISDDTEFDWDDI